MKKGGGSINVLTLTYEVPPLPHPATQSLPMEDNRGQLVVKVGYNDH